MYGICLEELSVCVDCNGYFCVIVSRLKTVDILWLCACAALVLTGSMEGFFTSPEDVVHLTDEGRVS